jgi:hypothetical protein
MNMTAQEAALAWAQGKKVETRVKHSADFCWLPIADPGDNATRDTCLASVFNEPSYEFRLAPEPKLRPLTIEEWKGHLGAGVVYKANGDLSTIGGVSPGRELVSVYANQGFSPEEMLENFTFISGSPCGAMEGGAK